MARFYINPTAKIGELQSGTILDLNAELSNMKIENDLRREVVENIKRLRNMGTYRGRRHAMGLPVRGQNTRSQVRGPLHWALLGSSRPLRTWINCTIRYKLLGNSTELSGRVKRWAEPMYHRGKVVQKASGRRNRVLLLYQSIHLERLNPQSLSFSRLQNQASYSQ